MSESLTVIFAHGVGMWPRLFEPVVGVIERPHHLWVRPGYAGHPSVETFGAQVAVLEEAVGAHAPAVVVGVGGGATLALACAIRGASGLAGIVTHEPLVGSLEPELDAKIRQVATELGSAPSVEAATDRLVELYGEATWRALPGFARAWAGDHYEVICREVELFASFRPTLAGLDRIRVPHHTTVGKHSAASRYRVATVLDSTGASVSVVRGAGHLVHADNPDGFAADILDFLSRRVAVA